MNEDTLFPGEDFTPKFKPWQGGLAKMPEPVFDGETYEPGLDSVRLKGQLLEVYRVMSDHRWHTLEQIAFFGSGSEASISARLRDLRKDRFGHHDVERKRLAGGTFAYRLVEP